MGVKLCRADPLLGIEGLQPTPIASEWNLESWQEGRRERGVPHTFCTDEDPGGRALGGSHLGSHSTSILRLIIQGMSLSPFPP